MARSEYGLMIQLLAGLITCLLLAIYCHDEYNERVSVRRVRELRIKIRNESVNGFYDPPDPNHFNEQNYNTYANT